MRIIGLFKDVRGAGSIEYALVASLIAIAAIAGYGNLGDSVEGTFNTVTTEVTPSM